MELMRIFDLWISRGARPAKDAFNVRPAISVRDEKDGNVCATLRIETKTGPREWTACVTKEEAEEIRKTIYDWVHARNAKALARMPAHAKAAVMGMVMGEDLPSPSYDEEGTLEPGWARKKTRAVPKTTAVYDPEAVLPLADGRKAKGRVTETPYDPDAPLAPSRSVSERAKAALLKGDVRAYRAAVKEMQAKGKTSAALDPDAPMPMSTSGADEWNPIPSRDSVRILGEDAVRIIGENHVRSLALSRLNKTCPPGLMEATARNELANRAKVGVGAAEFGTPDALDTQPGEPRDILMDFGPDTTFLDDATHEDEMQKKMKQGVQAIDKTLVDAMYGEDVPVGADLQGAIIGRSDLRKRGTKPIVSDGEVIGWTTPDHGAVKKFDKANGKNTRKFVPSRDKEKLALVRGLNKTLIGRRAHYLAWQKGSQTPSPAQLAEAKAWSKAKIQKHGLPISTTTTIGEATFSALPQGVFWDPRTGALPGTNPATGRYGVPVSADAQHPAPGSTPATPSTATIANLRRLPPGARPSPAILAALNAWQAANRGDPEMKREVLAAKADERRGVPIARVRMNELRAARRWWKRRMRLRRRTAAMGSNGQSTSAQAKRLGPLPDKAFASVEDWVLDALIRSRAGEKAAWVSVNSATGDARVKKAIALATSRLAVQTPGKIWKSPNGYAYKATPDGSWVRLPGISTSMGLSAVNLDPRSWFWWSKEEVELRKKRREAKQRAEQLENIVPIAEETLALRARSAEMEKAVQQVQSAGIGTWPGTAASINLSRATVVGNWWNPPTWFRAKIMETLDDSQAEAPRNLPFLPNESGFRSSQSRAESSGFNIADVLKAPEQIIRSIAATKQFVGKPPTPGPTQVPVTIVMPHPGAPGTTSAPAPRRPRDDQPPEDL